ncbi:MAG: sulfite exporter TauE/SafE family protein [Leptothrix sp. (in: b-proteobacteria)]
MDMSFLGTALGAVVGLILALTGAGGGILAVPLLVFGLHLTMVQAAPIGLVAVGMAALLGALLGLREGIVRYRAALLIGCAGMLMAPLGLWLAQRLPNRPLLFAFALVLAYASWRIHKQAQRALAPTDEQAPQDVLPCVVNPQEGRLLWTLPCARALAGTGLMSGLLSGMLGVGGGFVIVPALTRYTDLATRSILATSLAVIALVSVGGVAAAAASGAIVWPLAWPFTVGAVGGLMTGKLIAKRLAGPRLQQGFAVVGACVSVLLVARSLGLLLP